jgi:hypothetical protein
MLDGEMDEGMLEVTYICSPATFMEVLTYYCFKYDKVSPSRHIVHYKPDALANMGYVSWGDILSPRT